MESNFDIENIKKESCLDYDQQVMSGLDTNSVGQKVEDDQLDSSQRNDLSKTVKSPEDDNFVNLGPLWQWSDEKVQLDESAIHAETKRVIAGTSIGSFVATLESQVLLKQDSGIEQNSAGTTHETVTSVSKLLEQQSGFGIDEHESTPLSFGSIDDNFLIKSEDKRIASKPMETEDADDKSEIDITLVDQTEIKQEVSLGYANLSQEIKLEEGHRFSNQNVGHNNASEETISDLTCEPIIHVICPENERGLIFESRNNSKTPRKTSPTEFKHGCPICGKKFRLKKTMILHKVVHISKKNFYCTEQGCGKKYKTKENFQHHTRYSHKMKHKCPDCGKTFKNKSYLSKHLKRFHVECEPIIPVICPENELGLIFESRNNSRTSKKTSPTEFKHGCPICGKKFKLERDMILHKFVHVSKKKFHCTEQGCGKRYKAKQSLVRHMRYCHTMKRKCPDCHKTFKTSSNPRTPEQEFQFECPACGKKFEHVEIFPCPECDCGKTFNTKYLLSQHLKMVHVEPNYKCDKCPDCNKVCKTLDSLKRHMSLHEAEASETQRNNHATQSHSVREAFQCLEYDCGKTFKSKNYLSRHLTRGHVEPNYKCPHCDKVYQSANGLKYHMSLHKASETQQNIHCPKTDCGKTFRTECNLSQHIKRFHVEANYKCPDCDKIYKSAHGLKYHMSLHKASETQQYIHCPKTDCGKTFRLRHNLSQHMTRFHVEPNFKCPKIDCGKTFKIRSSLSRHMKSVHVERVHLKCPDCNRVFKSPHVLKAHISAHILEPCENSLNIPAKPSYSDVETFHSPENDCSETNKAKNRFSEHLKMVHVKPFKYKCPDCNRAYAREASLKSHIMSIHKTESSVTGEATFKGNFSDATPGLEQSIEVKDQKASYNQSDLTTAERTSSQTAESIQVTDGRVSCNQSDLTTSERTSSQAAESIQVTDGRVSCNQSDLTTSERTSSQTAESIQVKDETVSYSQSDLTTSSQTAADQSDLSKMVIDDSLTVEMFSLLRNDGNPRIRSHGNSEIRNHGNHRIACDCPNCQLVKRR